MITPELTKYIQEQLALGKTRMQIENDLYVSGGWKAEDLKEAFIVIGSSTTAVKQQSHKKRFLLITVVLLLVLGGISFAAKKFYGPQIKATLAGVTKDLFKNNTDIESESTSSPNQAATGGTIICDDMDCFIKAAATCGPASVTAKSSVDIFGMILHVTGSSTVAKSDSENICAFTSTSQDISVTFGEQLRKQLSVEGKTEAQLLTAELEATREYAEKGNGTKLECAIPSMELVSMLKKWLDGSSSSEDLASYNCITTLPNGQKSSDNQNIHISFDTNSNTSTYTDLHIYDNSGGDDYYFEVIGVSATTLNLKVYKSSGANEFIPKTLNLNSPEIILGHTFTLISTQKSATIPNQYSATLKIK